MEKIVILQIEEFIFKVVTTADFEADVNVEVFRTVNSSLYTSL